MLNGRSPFGLARGPPAAAAAAPPQLSGLQLLERFAKGDQNWNGAAEEIHRQGRFKNWRAPENCSRNVK